MKKLFAAALMAPLFLFTGCISDEPSENYRKLSVPLPTVVIPANTSLPAFFTSEAVYQYKIETYTGNCTISLADLPVQGTGNLAFTTPTMAGSQNNNVTYNYNSFLSDNGITIKDFCAMQMSAYYTPDGSNSLMNPVYGVLTNASFTVDGLEQYRVFSFPKMLCYGGATTTSYANVLGDTESFMTDRALYQVKLNTAAGTAEVVIYNAQFAPSMPVLSVMYIGGLKLTADRNSGYVIKGTNIVPEVGAGVNATPYPQFAFDTFELRPGGVNLTSAEIKFSVAGKYNGMFTGTYLKSYVIQ